MTRNKFFFYMLVFFCVSIIAWASYAMIGGEKEEEPYRISVIVNDSNNDRWIALRQGLEQAAKDYHIALNYVSTGKLKNAGEETALIRRELENGAQGVIVQAITDETEPFELSKLSGQTAFILLESDAGLGGRYTVVGPDNKEIGKALAQALIQDFGESLSGKAIGILSGNSSGFALQQRQQGLSEGLRGQETVIAWDIRIMESGPQEEQERFAEMELPDIMIALDNDGTERMIDVMQSDEGKADCALYGVGGSEKAVYYLDKGVLKTLVVPNEFKMGYQSMEAAANRLQYHTEQAQACEVDYLVVEQADMYEPGNQKVLFPIVQ